MIMLLAGTVACNDSGPSEEADIKAGVVLYQSSGCAICHGRDGRGDGLMAKNFNPPPRDFRRYDAYQQGRSIDEVAKTLETGLVTEGRRMPGYPHLSEQDRRLIAAYVVFLQGQE